MRGRKARTRVNGKVIAHAGRGISPSAAGLVLARTDAPIGCGAARGPRGKQPTKVFAWKRSRCVTRYFPFWKKSQSWCGGHNIGASRLIALVHVRFRTENLRPTTERVISSVVVVVG